MSENARKPPFADPALEKSAAGPGATGIFGIVSPEPVPSTTMLPPPPPAAMSSLPPIVVHEVTVQATEVANPSEDDALQRLLRSERTPRAQAPVAVPPAPQRTAPPQGPGEFTQLLSTLQVPGLAAAVPAQAPAAPVPTLPPNPVSAEPSTYAAASPGVSREADDDLSFTRLFEALGATPTASPGPSLAGASRGDLEPSAAPTFHAPDAGRAPGFLPGTSAPFGAPAAPGAGFGLPSAKTASAVPPPEAASTKGTVGFREELAPVFEPSAKPSTGGETDPASFTQLFAALGQGPRPEPSQAADYPPLRAESPAHPQALPRFQAEPSYSAPWPSQGNPSPVAQARPPVPEYEELQSLTQLLQALESSGTARATGTQAPESLFPGRERGHSGATVAFTPPESVQRAEARGPMAPAGPGDFTRVLQTSALRESGIGSQAAAARSTPEPPPPSAAPVHAAPAPLPPWAAAPVPHVPQLPYLAHVNGGGAGLHVHTNLPSYPHAAFSAPAHAAPVPASAQQTTAELRRGRMPVLLFVLLAIIVILVGVLVAVLLHR